MSEFTGGKVVEFLDYAAKNGLMNKATAGSLSSAVRKVLEVTHPETNWDDVDVSSLDLNDVGLRFETLSRTQYKPDSLQVYKSRFKNAVKMHSEWVANPSGWRYKAERPAAARKKPPSAEGAGTAQGKDIDHTTGETNSPPKPPVHESIIAYPYPLRPGMVVQINLPPDLRATEARRLAAFIESLVAEDQLALPRAEQSGSQN
jgi:hypothetical protein